MKGRRRCLFPLLWIDSKLRWACASSHPVLGGLLGTVADQLNKILGATVSNTAIAPDKSTGTGRTVTGATMLVLAVLGGFFGFAWIVMFYVSQGTLPSAALGSWNLVGGGFFFVSGIPMLIAGILLLVSGSRQRRRV